MGNWQTRFSTHPQGGAPPQPPPASHPEPLAKNVLGAWPYANGTFFRVWAPHAEAVTITIKLNGQGESTYPMLSENGTGCWTARLPQTKPGDLYKYGIFYQGECFDRTDPYARDIEPYNHFARIPLNDFQWDPTPFRAPAWNHLVLYEMHIGSFNPSNAGAPGDFYSAIQKLGHLKELGVNAVEVMPIIQCGFSWGYSGYGLFPIKDKYGGSQGFMEFVRAAHAHGIAVIMDVVFNHLTARAERNLLWQFDGWGKNTGGIYFYPDQRSWTEWGPRPNFSEEIVRRLIADNVRMWLDEYQCDGLRWDATAFIRRYQPAKDQPMIDLPEGWELMKEILRDARARWPEKLMIAEDLQPDAYRLTLTTAEGGLGFGTQWDAGFLHVVREVLAKPHDADRDMGTLQWAITNRYAPDVFKRVIYTESHDDVADRHGKLRMARLVQHPGAGSTVPAQLALLAAALTLTAPGIPMLFQGQEVLEEACFTTDTRQDWSRAQTQAPFLRCVSDLIRLRKNEGQTTRGLGGQSVNVFHINHTDKVMAFHRWDTGGARDDTVVVLNLSKHNFGSYIIGFPRSGRWVVRLNSAAAYTPASAFKITDLQVNTTPGEKDGLRQWAELRLPPYSALILSQD